MILSVDLTVRPGGDGSFRCQGTVEETDKPVATNPAESVALWLGGLDAAELERVALERQSQITGSYTAVVLAVLSGWARGDI